MARAVTPCGLGGVELPITPMLDMTFQLLFFFVLSYHPQAMEGQLAFQLAASRSGGEPAPKLEPTEIDDDQPLTILVRTARDGVNDGNISSLIVQSVEGDTTMQDLPALRNFLQRRAQDQHVRADIKIQAEGKLKYGCLIDVMDACVKANAGQVSFAAPPDLDAN